jgi:hypothetical protein
MRLIWILLLAYLAYKLLQILARKSTESSGQQEVRGKNRSNPLDLDGADIQDARFEDIDEHKDKL